MSKAPKPKRSDYSYLVGWFKVATGGNHHLAASMARDYRRALK